ncbi:O-antigen ligase family protein [Aquirufa sp.]|jgi:O-antigen ligase/tetratricopeptide (TPR) repeat protein|uniref:O-antigen ligase family protein n=1 Tax=Aquirufa sp. TaxID=2676249 RepID=UPI003784C9CE
MKTSLSTLIAILASMLYLAVYFIPDMGGSDVMGAQWLYASSLSLVLVGYIAIRYSTYAEAISQVYTYKFTLVFSLLLFWAIGSYFYAINPTETLVTLARLITTYFVFINLSILFYQQDRAVLFTGIAYGITAYLFFDSIYVLKTFSANLRTMDLDAAILGLNKYHGNKNVTAASLLIMIPFAMYVIMSAKWLGRIAGIITLSMGVFALFLMNTRSTYVGFALITVLFFVGLIWQNKSQIKPALLFFLLPAVLAIFAANTRLQLAVAGQENAGGYGTVTKRLGQITEGSDRLHLWGTAIDYSLKNPILGAGYGNWKLASIPYERELANELFVPYHAHNDFIEMFADLGLLGGLCFAGMFVLLLYYTFQFLRTKCGDPLMVIIAFLAVTCYGVDALLNFPAERTAMQSMLSLAAALVLIPLDKSARSFTAMPVVYLLLGIVLLTPSIYVANETFESLKIQKFVMGEVNSDPKMATIDVEKLPDMPNLSSSTLPMKAMMARYYIRDKRFDDALRVLKESENDNPFLHYNDFLRTSIYASLNKMDSAHFYAKRAFNAWPRASSYYKNMIFTSAKLKDTNEIKRALQVSLDAKNDIAITWNQYLLGMFEVKRGTDKALLETLNQTLKKFPADTAILNPTRVMLMGGNSSLQSLTAKGNALFVQGKYTQAAQAYIEMSKLDTGNFTHLENAGICFYAGKRFAESLIYFAKSEQHPGNNTGKSAYFGGMSQLSLGKKPEACASFQRAQLKSYPDAAAAIAQNCK